MKRIVVIGIGNILMQDDGIGVLIVNAIKFELQKLDIEAFSGETDVQYCLDQINQDDFLIMIDAIQQQNRAGNIQLIGLNQAISNITAFDSQHQFSMFEALRIYYPHIQGYLIGIETEQFNMGVAISERLASNFTQISDEVLEIILNISKDVI